MQGNTVVTQASILLLNCYLITIYTFFAKDVTFQKFTVPILLCLQVKTVSQGMLTLTMFPRRLPNPARDRSKIVKEMTNSPQESS